MKSAFDELISRLNMAEGKKSDFGVMSVNIMFQKLMYMIFFSLNIKLGWGKHRHPVIYFIFKMSQYPFSCI